MNAVYGRLAVTIPNHAHPPSQPPCPSEVLPTCPSGVWENRWTAESISLREAYELQPRKKNFFSIYFIEVQLIYNVVLVSPVQHSNPVIRRYTFSVMFFSIMVYHRIFAWRILWTEEPGRATVHGVAKSQTTEMTQHIEYSSLGYTVGPFFINSQYTSLHLLIPNS